jgi:hypothetical protein
MQGKVIALSCGGLGNICPTFRARQAAGERLSSAQVLTEMGLTVGKASAVIEVLYQNGFNGGPQTGEKAAQARGILLEVGGIACPAPAR